MNIIKEGHSGYGYCYIEERYGLFYVVIMDGKSTKGPYRTLKEAMEEFSHWCI